MCVGEISLKFDIKKSNVTISILAVLLLLFNKIFARM